jgi:hypothetical protein
VDGIQQVSRKEFEDMFANQYTKLRGLIAEPAVVAPETPALATNNPTERIEPDGWKSWDWGGQLRRPVPQGWAFPVGTVRSLMDLFKLGIPALCIRPFMLVSCKQLIRDHQANFCKAQFVFNLIKERAIQSGEVSDDRDFDDLPVLRWNLVFQSRFSLLVQELKSTSGLKLKKPGDLACNTFYKYVKNMLKVNAVVGTLAMQMNV